ncbi:MAG: hypothetical protein BAJATHORv1_140005 [Candidatus Thorarchaeota archaeon]|nr:MAG: hypothetical protein BAJATHORv1_140005 [Candidatus Thorarchaeota archaeon]
MVAAATGRNTGQPRRPLRRGSAARQRGRPERGPRRCPPGPARTRPPANRGRRSIRPEAWSCHSPRVRRRASAGRDGWRPGARADVVERLAPPERREDEAWCSVTCPPLTHPEAGVPAPATGCRKPVLCRR